MAYAAYGTANMASCTNAEKKNFLIKTLTSKEKCK